MSKNNKSQIKNIWLVTTSVATLVPIAGLFIVAAVNTETHFRLAGIIAGYVMYISLACSVVLAVAIYKLSGKSRVLPIIGLLIALLITGMAYFTHWFNVY